MYYFKRLDDKRVKAFITHMGLNSYLETSHAGVPIVAIPLFGDQMQNAEAASRNGYCIRLVKTDLRSKLLVRALKEILHEPMYVSLVFFGPRIFLQVLRKSTRNCVIACCAPNNSTRTPPSFSCAIGRIPLA